MKKIKALAIVLGVSLLIAACGAGKKDSNSDKTRTSEGITQVASQENETVNTSDADTKASEGESGTEKTGEDTMNRTTILLENEQVGVFTFDKGTEFDFQSELSGKLSIYTFSKKGEPTISGLYINEDQAKEFESEFTSVEKKTRDKDKVEYWRYEKKNEQGEMEQNVFVHFPGSKMYFYIGGAVEEKEQVDRVFDALTFYYSVDKDGKLQGAE